MPTAFFSVYGDSVSQVVRGAVQDLLSYGWDVRATRETADALHEEGVQGVIDVAGVWGLSALEKRVIPFSRELHGALVATDSPDDLATLGGMRMPKIDFLYVELPPNAEEVKADYSSEASFLEAFIKTADLGGISLVRSACLGGRIVACDEEFLLRALDLVFKRKRKRQRKEFVRQHLIAAALKNVARYCNSEAAFHARAAKQIA